MQEKSEMSSKAWVSLLWAQYNKLPEPLKEGFVGLAQGMANEAGDEESKTETKEAAMLHKCTKT